MIRDWAASEPLVLEAFIFGSRAKGCARPDSDIDIALTVAGQFEGESDGNWICEASRWKEALNLLLPVPMDLWSISPGDEKVGPAVEEHGVLAFRRD